MAWKVAKLSADYWNQNGNLTREETAISIELIRLEDEVGRFVRRRPGSPWDIYKPLLKLRQATTGGKFSVKGRAPEPNRGRTIEDATQQFVDAVMGH